MDDRLRLHNPPFPEMVLEVLQAIRQGLEFDGVVESLVSVIPPETVEPRVALGADVHHVMPRMRSR